MLPALSKFDCVILRGLPGSGKSTFAKKLAKEFNFVHLEADDHLHVNGVYRFDPARVSDAHALVTRETVAHLAANRNVVVAHTNVRLWEMASVVGAASLLQKTYCFVELIGRWDNIHDVSEDVVSSMSARWERLPESCAGISFSHHPAA